MICEAFAYDADGVEITHVSAMQTIGNLRTAFLNLGSVCGTLSLEVNCADVNGTCVGGNRKTYVFLTDRKPSNDYCGNGVCGRGEFDTCDWDCGSFDKIPATSIILGNTISVTSFGDVITCRLDRDWADVTRKLPLSYECGSVEEGGWWLFKGTEQLGNALPEQLQPHLY